MKKRKNIIVLIACLAISYFVAFIGSLLTGPAVKSSWYQEIRPALTPPNWVFPVVWNVLFFLIALSLYFAWENKKERKTTAILFGVNFALNILWSALYFGMRNPLAAFIEIIFLWLSILAMVIVLRKINKLSSWLLVPYLLWVGFASVLNYLSI